MSDIQGSIKKRAQEFYRKRKETGDHYVKVGACPNLTVDELLQQTPPIDAKTVDRYLIDEKISGIKPEVVEQTRESLHRIRKSINQFPQSKRFFILQTIDFFNTPSYIDKVVPALLHLNKIGYKHDVLEFVYSTFSTLNRNIETIISISSLFSQASLHLERGGLYTLSADIAKSIGNLFSNTYYQGFKDKTSDVGRVIEIFKPYRQNAENQNGSNVIPQVQQLIEPESRLRQAVLDFISQIQTHGLLQLYSKKRNDFYKQFLKQILSKNKLNLLKPDVSSIVLAGCLVANSQLVPQQRLLERMISLDLYNKFPTNKAYSDFVDQLAPTAVYDIIGDYKKSIRMIADGGTEMDVAEIGKRRINPLISFKKLKNRLINNLKI